MNIAIDISPLKSGHYLQHRVRGTGFYLINLQKSLEEYFPENKYNYFNRGEVVSKDIDVIHYPYFEPFFLTLPFFSHNKKVVTVHDLTPLVFPGHFRSGLKGAIKWQIQKAALRSSNAIITDSESSKKDIIKYAGVDSHKIKVVYLAAGSEFRKLEIKNLKLEIKKRYGLPDRFALYVGDATWNKNLPRLIKAVTKIKIPLVMVGKALVEKKFDKKNPWNKDLVEVQTLIDSNKNIFSLGFVPTGDLVSLYNTATLLAMPSIYEGFGLPILEAMSCGCPVVTSAEGSLSEVVGEAGKYVDPYDVESIANGIAQVFNNKDLQKELSWKGIVQSKKFTWRRTAEETVSVYKGIVNDVKGI
ncbi:MAG: glycosyltransferase family 1 protein [Candidatus Levybacteria bacterium]|nr:glycosyltransferase family 1 protein [Candidatus Levybacteria bacterium]